MVGYGSLTEPGNLFVLMPMLMRSIAAQIIFHVVAYSFCTKLLFVGAEVKFHPTAGMESGFIIVKYEKSANLVFFEEIILRCTSEGDNTKQKVRIFPITKETPCAIK